MYQVRDTKRDSVEPVKPALLDASDDARQRLDHGRLAKAHSVFETDEVVLDHPGGDPHPGSSNTRSGHICG